MVAKTFQLPYAAVILSPLKLQKNDSAIRAFNKFTVLREGTFLFSQLDRYCNFCDTTVFNIFKNSIN